MGLEFADVGNFSQFDLSCVSGYEAAYEDAKRRGIHIKALVICNPHNPLGNWSCQRRGDPLTLNPNPGRCYPRETLEGLLRFCASKGTHLISDEIYATSVYVREDRESETFTSVRSIDLTGIIDATHVHVLYGLSKVFCFSFSLRIVLQMFWLVLTTFGIGFRRVWSENGLPHFSKCRIHQGSQVNLVCIAFPYCCRTLRQKLMCFPAAFVSRFCPPSHFSMDIATKLLEDKSFLTRYLNKARFKLLQSRLLAEDLLRQAGIPYYDEGYVLHVHI